MKKDTSTKRSSKKSKEAALYYMKTLAGVAREILVILDADLRVVYANTVFYEKFHIKPEDTENKFIYELGNGQWNILKFKKLLKEILPKEKVVKNYEIVSPFEAVGEKTLLLNAGQIDAVELIILAVEEK